MRWHTVEATKTLTDIVSLPEYKIIGKVDNLDVARSEGLAESTESGTNLMMIL